ncbi:MAG TPA: extracellular solute-binding protein [bacterium]|nr:extracellular solute-binding protein [bacterium]
MFILDLMFSMLKIFFLFFYLFLNFLNADTVYLFHSFRGNDKKALEYIANIYNLKNPLTQVKLLQNEPDTYLIQLEKNYDKNNGPDIFIWANDKIGYWVEKKIIIPIDEYIDFRFLNNFISSSLTALKYGKNKKLLYGLPFSIECLILFYNKNYLNKPPETFQEFLDSAIKFTNPKENKFGLVYEIDNFYFHALWVHSFNGRVFDENNKLIIDSEPLVESLKLTYSFLNVYKIVPEVPLGKSWWDYQLELFNDDRALFLISGPWIIGSFKKNNWAVSTFPKFGNNFISPFLGVKGIYVTNKKRTDNQLKNVIDVIKFFTSEQAGIIMGNIGGYIPANINSYKDEILNSDKVKVIIKDEAMNSIPMPNIPEMSIIWEIMNNKSLSELGLLKKAQSGLIKFNEILSYFKKEYTHKKNKR